VIPVAGTPPSAVGRDGDIAWDVTAKQLFGPKAAGAWPSPVSIAGPTGPTGSLTLQDVIDAISSNATLRAAIKAAANS
jgi:hypothetical protein